MDSFGIIRVNRLRKAAERAREGRDSEFSLDRDSFPRCDGWSVSFIDPTNLLKVFKTLWLKDGFALHGYEFTSGGNGNGVIWAVPFDAPVLKPEECPRLEDVFLEPPKPPGAIKKRTPAIRHKPRKQIWKLRMAKKTQSRKRFGLPKPRNAGTIPRKAWPSLQILKGI